jgi:hypothetical protein
MIMRQAWPFLLTKSTRQDYFTVLCPKYIIDKNLQRAFRFELTALSSEITVKPECKLLTKSALGKVTMYYKCDRAQVGGVDLKDAHDRTFVRVYGVIVNGLHHDIGNSEESKRAYRMALEQIEKTFADLCANPGDFDTRASLPTVISGGEQRPDMFAIRNQIVAAVIAFLLGMGLAYWPLKKDLQNKQTEVDEVRRELEVRRDQINRLEAQLMELRRQLEEKSGLPPTPPAGSPLQKR